MTNQNNGKYLPRDRKGRKNSPVSRILLVVALVSALIFGVTVFIALRNQIALKRMSAETARETTPISTSAPAETTVPTQATVPPTTAATGTTKVTVKGLLVMSITCTAGTKSNHDTQYLICSQ